MEIYSGYLFFSDEGSSPSGKTRIIGVYSNYDKDVKLGEIKWYSHWRRYVFYPNSSIEVLFDSVCLKTLAHQVEKITSDHNNKKKNEHTPSK